MGEFSISHILILLLIFLVFFGPSRLPQLGSSLGKAIREFKDSLSGVANEKPNATAGFQKEVKEQLPPATAQRTVSAEEVRETTHQHT